MTITLSWLMQNLVVISRVYFKPEHFKFWSNFEFHRNIASGTGARIVVPVMATRMTCPTDFFTLGLWQCGGVHQLWRTPGSLSLWCRRYRRHLQHRVPESSVWVTDVTLPRAATRDVYTGYVYRWAYTGTVWSPYLNSLWPCDAISWHRSRSALDHVMDGCLMAPRYYLNQCWLVIKGVLWHSSESYFTTGMLELNPK